VIDPSRYNTKAGTLLIPPAPLSSWGCGTPHTTVHHNTVQSSPVQYSTVQSSTVPSRYDTVQSSTVQYGTLDGRVVVVREPGVVHCLRGGGSLLGVHREELPHEIDEPRVAHGHAVPQGGALGDQVVQLLRLLRVQKEYSTKSTKIWTKG